MDTFYLSANYTLLLEHKDRIYTANIILGVLIAVILLNGITNYAATLLANQTMRKKLLYFQFFYPWQAMLVLGILLLLICLALAGIMYRTNRKQTMRERLSLL